MTLLDVRKAISNIMFKSATSEQFRKECLKQGKKVLENEMGQDLADNITVTFVENRNDKVEKDFNGNNLVFVIPEFVGAVVKLNKEQLEAVNGGMIENSYYIKLLYSLI